ncbi:hydrogenase maturation nickel metallochaperone HypA [Endomicrobium proavitum]|uniref:Hydrogenase maturation factor HypA n=1 Tax=Endomicrobium proavitum TaxID=1408281 RepID=A0A0G3WH75_9BACT|nr:hydrogenase maturation nickel metallochaperone HypA [Endomicrobium proavitum]AKL97683.1 putative hydrogenase nickel incorporation protein HypA [Endomicrobium proavitum]
MHEHGIARDLWKTVLAEAEKNGLKKITKLTVVLGEASGIEKDFLNHSFVDHIFKEEEIAKGAEVEYVVSPLEAVCNVCHKRIKAKDMDKLLCPYCGANNIKITSGRDVFISSIEGD